MLGKGVSKRDLYVLEDTNVRSTLPTAFSSIPVLANNALWQARLCHPTLAP